MKHVQIKPLSGSIGAEIFGIDVTQELEPQAVEFIWNRLVEFHVIFFPRQPTMTPEQQLRFGRYFGPLHTDFPSFAARRAGSSEIIVFDGDKPGGRAAGWHTDATVSAAPPKACILAMKRTPEKGGDTMWTDTIAAYESLSPAFQRVLEGMTVVHDMFSDSYLSRPGEKLDYNRYTEIDVSKVGRAEHPLVTVIPETGKKCLFVNPLFTSHIKGLNESESGLILDFLFQRMVRPDFVCRRHWEVGDIAFWDNRCTMHAVVNDFGSFKRLAERVSIQGDVPMGVSP
jgi:taurine dioxygenase